jgi:hypothetical protein
LQDDADRSMLILVCLSQRCRTRRAGSKPHKPYEGHGKVDALKAGSMQNASRKRSISNRMNISDSDTTSPIKAENMHPE